jgi:hypothetical protein
MDGQVVRPSDGMTAWMQGMGKPTA